MWQLLILTDICWDWCRRHIFPITVSFMRRVILRQHQLDALLLHGRRGQLFPLDLLFTCKTMPGLKVAAEICEDLWTPNPPSVCHAMHGATVIVNLSASDEVTGKDSYRRDLVKIQSGRLVCGYIYASAGEGESSTDLVFGGHHLIAENGSVLAESERFTNETIYGDLDIERLVGERRHYTTYDVIADADGYIEVEYEMASADAAFDRYVDKAPFVPGRKEEREKRCGAYSL